MNIGKLLTEIRKSQGKSRQQVADDIDISIHTLIKYENGQTDPPYERLIKLSKYYNVSTDYLLGINEDEPKELVDLIGERYHLDSASRGLVAMYLELEPKQRTEFIKMLKSHINTDED